MADRSDPGFTLIEVMFAMAVLLVGVLGVAAVLTSGIKALSTSPGDVIGAQKAAQAIESVFAARDSHQLTWAQIRNVNGAASDKGVFLDGPQPLKLAGLDGLVNTADDGTQPIEGTRLAGQDQLLNTADDETTVLSNFTREIVIRDVPNANGNLRSITVVITYRLGADTQSYTVTTYISSYS